MQAHELSFARQAASSLFGLRKAGLLTTLLLILAGSASAQVSTASVNGVVRDPKGAVIPGATIVLSSVDTSIQRTSVPTAPASMSFSTLRRAVIR